MNDLFKIGKYWAIEPDYLKAISKESLSTRSEKPLNNSRSVSIRDGTAIIPIHGVITARTTLFSLLEPLIFLFNFVYFFIFQKKFL